MCVYVVCFIVLMLCSLSHLNDKTGRVEKEGKKEMFYLTTHSTHFIYGYIIDINALAQGIKSFLASQVWLETVAGARTYGTDSPAITSQLR